MKPKISIIIPVYNVEKWLNRSFISLQNQQFSDFEVWLVNDGSTDNSGEICENITKADKRFNVVHQLNKGAASARNTAIPKAKGKYLYFMDPDDWCEKPMLYDMFNAAEKFQAELLITGFYIDTYYTDDKYYKEKRTAPNKVYSTQQDFRNNAHKLFDEQLLYPPWNKLYLNDYIKKHHILFPKTFWDDLPFNLDVIKDVKKVACINNRYYHFLRARQESENTKYRPNMYQKREEENYLMRNLYKYWQIGTPEIEEFLSRRYTERLIGCIENLTNKNCTLSRKEKITEINKIISTPHAIKALSKTHPKSLMMKLMLMPLKKQSVNITMLEGYFISFVKQNSTNIFARLKANR